ncbi:hypothetical protein [Sorangium sp. So ce131]|uniref:hypothetical protein n=1 Tax=Sorangium sp. So ce131 TaxID=3133282 RepID=UPI003F6150AD
MFHPDGVVYRAAVRSIAVEGEVGALSQRLAGPALVRLSGGIWRWRGGRGERRPDLLGVSVRFRSSEQITPAASAGDQDLLFVSARYLALIAFGFLTTNRHDFLRNDYYAQLPFEVAGFGRAEFRLIPLRAVTTEGNRVERLERAAAEGLALLRLEVRRRGAFRQWMAVADIVLEAPVAVDQNALCFDPFHTGRGIVPSGLLQATRLATYTAGYLGRRLAARGRGARARGASGARGEQRWPS